MCVCVNVSECPWRLQPDHRSESSIPAALCSLLPLPSRPVAMAAAAKAVSMAKGGSWHPPLTDLLPPPLSLSPPAWLLTRW